MPAVYFSRGAGLKGTGVTWTLESSPLDAGLPAESSPVVWPGVDGP